MIHYFEEILNNLLENEETDDEYGEKEHAVTEDNKGKMYRARISVKIYFSKEYKVIAESIHTKKPKQWKLKLLKIEFIKSGSDVKNLLSFGIQFK